MDRTSEHDATTGFMLAEYEDLYQNVMHVEDKLFGHLSFFTTLFTGILTASVAIYGLVGQKKVPPWTNTRFSPSWRYCFFSLLP